MARPSVAARNLSSTEELERLEQSITLTLQEIDSNFSKAHRIVTTSIIPIVEQYGEHSRAVWEASKFWKQFFEASANVSLSGYEELANDDDTTMMEESTATRDDTAAKSTPQREPVSTPARKDDIIPVDESMLDDAELLGSTPRAGAKVARANMSDIESPYEAMRREMKSEEAGQTTVLEGEEDDSSILFAQRTAQLPDMTMTPQALLDKRSKEQTRLDGQPAKDPLLHRILDKNYRLQATPHKSPAKRKDKSPAKPSWQDSAMSSPEMAVPKMRSEAFMSPYKSTARKRHEAVSQGPRTPGISVQSPGMGKKTRSALGDQAADKGKSKYDIEWDSDDEDLMAGRSPPKTIQFALPPSKLLQTPAREASKRIVGDILQDAGVEVSEYSPTMVKMNEDILNDSF